AVRARPELGQRLRFSWVTLREPPKQQVLAFKPGDRLSREAFVVVLDNDSATTYEAIVSLDAGLVTSMKAVPDVQPPMIYEEFMDCDQVVKNNPESQAAMRKRGAEGFDLARMKLWTAG